MHWRSEAELLPLDIEIEKTLRNLKKMRAAEATTIAEPIEGNQNIPVVAIDRPQQRQRTIIREECSVVRQPPIEANNFELKPDLITMVQQNQFTGHPSEYPNEHLGIFFRMANIVK